MHIKTKKNLAIFAFLFFSINLLIFSVYFINPTQQAIITQFGEIVEAPKTEPGLHFKVPFIQKVNYIPQHRVYTWNRKFENLLTKDKNSLNIDVRLLWQIGDPIKYFKGEYNEESVKKVFDDEIISAIKKTISSYKLSEVFEEKLVDKIQKNDISAQINENVLEEINPRLNLLGFAVFKLEIKPD